jgi:hypothetical protein
LDEDPAWKFLTSGGRMFVSVLILLVSGSVVFGLKRLLVDHPDKLGRFMCQLSRTQYPPPAGSWAIKYQIGKMKVLLWALLVLSSITACVMILGLVASILLKVFYPGSSHP